jgi:NADH-quinone oxidoreductase subunit H
VLSIAGAPIDIGVVYILAVGSVAVYGVIVGGYASNNKYSFLGGMRATAQMLSYEIPLGLSVLTMILLSGTARADGIVNLQAGGGWNIIRMPLLAVIFFICNLAETNRAPFDLAEAEQELVGGYHTEYSSMKFALFFLAEYAHMITAAAFFSVLFLGGWSLNPFGRPDLPLVGGLGAVLLKFAVFGLKIFFYLALMMMVRWTLPRLRFDQLMRLAWRGLIPLALALLVLAAVKEYLGGAGWLLLVGNLGLAAGALALLARRTGGGKSIHRLTPMNADATA